MIPSSDNTLLINNYEAIKTKPGLLRLLPIIYIAWADAVLTSQEITAIRQLTAKQNWLTDEEKIIMNQWLDPANPPTSQQLKSWLIIIKQAAKDAAISSDASLAEVGIKLVQNTATNGDNKITSKEHASLHDIEKVLGIISSESFENLFASDEQEVVPPPKREANFDIGAMTTLLDGKDADIIKKVKSIITRPEFAYIQSTDKDVQR
jgi:acyl-CoA oxidase